MVIGVLTEKVVGHRFKVKITITCMPYSFKWESKHWCKLGCHSIRNIIYIQFYFVSLHSASAKRTRWHALFKSREVWTLRKMEVETKSFYYSGFIHSHLNSTQLKPLFQNCKSISIGWNFIYVLHENGEYLFDDKLNCV